MLKSLASISRRMKVVNSPHRPTSAPVPKTLIFTPFLQTAQFSSGINKSNKFVNLVKNRAFFSNSTAPGAKNTDFRDLDSSDAEAPAPAAPVVPKQPSNQPVLELNEDNFELIVMNSGLPVILYCYSPNITSSNKAVSDYEAILDKVVRNEDGYCLLARLDVTTNMNLAQELRVQQVPVIMALVGGRAVHVLPGIPSEDTVNKIVRAAMAIGYSDESQPVLDAADSAFKSENIPEAAKHFSTLFETKRFHMEPFALAGLASCALKEKNVSVAAQLVDQIKERYPEMVRHGRVKPIVSEVELMSSNVNLGDEKALLERLNQNPKDWEARYELGSLYQAAHKYQQAMDQLFEIIKGEREWNNQAARQLLVKMFDSMGEDNELAVKGKKRLNNLWFL